MPTRSGLNYMEINPEWYICAYCYAAYPNHPVFKYEGMISKRVTVRIDGDQWATLPDEWTQVWTQPHCVLCNRRVRGFPSMGASRKYKYV